jgi:hypothetical protein
MQTLTIPCQLPSLNETIARSKRHWSKYAADKKEYTALIANLARRQLRPVRSGLVYLTCVWYTRDRRTDPDNIASAKKFILDGLVTAGILQDDSMKHIAGFTDHFAVDRGRPRVEVFIESATKRWQNRNKTLTYSWSFDTQQVYHGILTESNRKPTMHRETKGRETVQSMGGLEWR